MNRSSLDITLGALIAIFGIKTSQAEPYWGWVIIPILILVVLRTVADCYKNEEK